MALSRHETAGDAKTHAMHRSQILAVNILVLALAAGIGKPLPAGERAPAVDTVQAQPLQQAQSRAEGERAMDAAVAAAVIGAVATRMGETRVEVKIDALEVAPVSLLESDVSGQGRLQLDADGEWLPFGFSTLYDNASGSVIEPRLVLGGAGGAFPAEPALATALEGEAAAMLHQEFAQQQARLSVGAMQQVPVGARLVRLEGNGLAHFEGEGAVQARVSGVYDRRALKWVMVDYTLGPESTREPLPAQSASVAAIAR